MATKDNSFYHEDDNFYGAHKGVQLDSLNTTGFLSREMGPPKSVQSEALTAATSEGHTYVSPNKLQFQNEVPDPSRNFQNDPLKQGFPVLNFQEAPSNYVFLQNAEDFQQTMRELTNILIKKEVDFQQKDSSIFGHLFSENNHCLYKLNLVKLVDEENQKSALVAYRLDGCGFSLSTFFEELTCSLRACGLVEHEYDESDEEMDFDDEFEGPTFTFTNYLNLAYDENLVDHWCERLKDGHFEEISSILLLLAHNADDAQNLKVISKHKQRLVDAIFEILGNNTCQRNLCIVRNICKVIFQLAGNGLINLSWEEVGTLMHILIDWSKEKPFDVNNPVTCSLEIQRMIALTLNALNLANAPEDYSSVFQSLTEIAQNSPNATVSKSLGEFVSHIAVC